MSSHALKQELLAKRQDCATLAQQVKELLAYIRVLENQLLANGLQPQSLEEEEAPIKKN